MKKVLSIVLFIVVLCSLTACSEKSPIDIVKTGELSDYPGKPFAATMNKAFSDKNVKVTENWEIITNQGSWKSILPDTAEAVRVTYSIEGEDGSFYFIVNMENEKFEIYGATQNGNEMSEDALASVLDDIFG